MKREQGMRAKLERNAGLVSIVVLSALLVPQIIARALPSDAGLVEIYMVMGVGLVVFALTYFMLASVNGQISQIIPLITVCSDNNTLRLGIITDKNTIAFIEVFLSVKIRVYLEFDVGQFHIQDSVE